MFFTRTTKKPKNELKDLPEAWLQHIFSFLLDENLDMIFNLNLFEKKNHSAISMIRGVNKKWKNLTDIWQIPFNDLRNKIIKPMFAADPVFKLFVRNASLDHLKDYHLLDLLHPVLSHSSKEILELLKFVLKDCHRWKKPSDEIIIEVQEADISLELEEISYKQFSSQSANQFPRARFIFELLYRTYVTLDKFSYFNPILDRIDPEQRALCLEYYQHQFKIILLYRVIELSSKLHLNNERDMDASYEQFLSLPSVTVDEHKAEINKVLSIGCGASCALPWAVILLLTITVMPDSNEARAPLFYASLILMLLSVIMVKTCYKDSVTELTASQHSRQFRQRLLATINLPIPEEQKNENQTPLLSEEFKPSFSPGRN